jgi:hypothetical protein
VRLPLPDKEENYNHAHYNNNNEEVIRSRLKEEGANEDNNDNEKTAS